MKLIRYLLSHALLLAFLIALAFAYHYRARLFSNEINTRIDSTVEKGMALLKFIPKINDSDPQQAATEQQEPVQETIQQADVAQPEPEIAVAQSEPQAPVSESETATEPVAEPEAPQTATDSQVDTVASEPIEQAPEVIPEQTQEQTQEPTQEPTTDQTAVQADALDPATEQAADTPDSESTVPSEQVIVASRDKEVVATGSDSATQPEPDAVVSLDKQAVTKSHAELISQARSAFQSGDSDKSISLYQELAELNPDDPNVYGELGNVFYAQGKWKQAGQAYYEAASRLLQHGQTGQVQYLYRVIQGLDQESADKLRSQMGG